MALSDTRWVGRKDFEEFGRRIGLSEKPSIIRWLFYAENIAK